MLAYYANRLNCVTNWLQTQCVDFFGNSTPCTTMLNSFKSSFENSYNYEKTAAVSDALGSGGSASCPSFVWSTVEAYMSVIIQTVNTECLKFASNATAAANCTQAALKANFDLAMCIAPDSPTKSPVPTPSKSDAQMLSAGLVQLMVLFATMYVVCPEMFNVSSTMHKIKQKMHF